MGKRPLVCSKFISFFLIFHCLPIGRYRLNVTNMEEPYFLVESLDTLHGVDGIEDRSYKVVIYAVNQKGRSSKVTLKDFVVGDRNQGTACKYLVF